LNDGCIDPGYKGRYISDLGGMASALEIIHQPVVNMVWEVEL